MGFGVAHQHAKETQPNCEVMRRQVTNRRGGTWAHRTAQRFARHGIYLPRCMQKSEHRGLCFLYGPGAGKKPAIAEQPSPILGLPTPLRQLYYELPRGLEETREPASKGWCLRWTRRRSRREGCFCWRRSFDCPRCWGFCPQCEFVQRYACLPSCPLNFPLSFD